MGYRLTPETAAAARDRGLITEEQFQRLAQEPAPVTETPTTEISPFVAAPKPDLASSLIQGARQNVSARESRMAAEDARREQMTLAESVDRQRSFLNESIENDLANGADEGFIRKKYGNQMARLEADQQRLSQIAPPASAAPAPAANSVLASDLEANEQQQQGAGSGFDLRGGTMRGYNLMEAGINQAALAGRQKAVEQAAYLDQTQKEHLRLIDEDRERKLHQKEVLDGAHQKYQEEVERVGATKIDAKNLYANMSTGDKVLAGISLFLGAFGPDGQNRAAGTISKAIDRDIEVQKAQLGARERDLDRQNGLLRRMMDRFGDENTAEAATRAAYLDNAQLKLKTIGAKYEGTEIAAKAQQLHGELELKKTAAMQQVEQAELARSGQIISKEDRERFVPGFGLALSKEDATKMKDLLAVTNTAKKSLNVLLDIADNGSKMSFEDRDRAFVTAQKLVGALRVPIVGPGAMTEKELELLKSIVSNPSNFMSLASRNKTRLQTLKDSLQGDVDSHAEAFGLTRQGALNTLGSPL